MIIIGNKEYSGSIASVTDDRIVAVINTVDSLQDVCTTLDGAKEVTEVLQDGTRKTYAITTAVSVYANTKTVYTIEGNSGNACKRKTYARGSGLIYGYGCPNYSGT